jgi:hypothetical protein
VFVLVAVVIARLPVRWGFAIRVLPFIDRLAMVWFRFSQLVRGD